MRLVPYIIKKFFDYSDKVLIDLKLSRDDILQQGKLGLAIASVKFDKNYGTRFSTYACSQIKGQIFRLIKNSFKNNFASMRACSDMIDEDRLGLLERQIDFEKCCERCLTKAQIEIVIDRVYNGLTFQEIAIKNNFPYAMQAFRIYIESMEVVKEALEIEEVG